MLEALIIARKESGYWTEEHKMLDATLFGEIILTQKHNILDLKGPTIPDKEDPYSSLSER